ncbi:XrtA/PEP-CTERM system TPR-repeat protein PrsT [Photobacterium kagoshimensis]|uniref:XrtA/PEP-CTERM system TPR-repeat protein PrsT n=1 Tax=Photobacterium kagoshimensis TaxID=2910242 RepID=UPI003D0C18A5
MTHNKSKTFTRLALASFITLSLAACNDKSTEEYLEQAQTYLEDQDTNAAIIELKNAIKQAPKDSQARQILGQIYLERGNFASAEKELEKAIRLKGDSDTLTPLLAQALLGQDKTEPLITLVDQTRTTDQSIKTELLAFKALALLKQGKIDDAQYTLSLAENAGQDTLYQSIGRATLDAANENIDSALYIVNNIVKEHSTSSDAWLLKGHLETAKGDNKAAARSYQKAVEYAPDAIQYTLYLAQALVRDEAYKDADKYVSKLIKMSNNHVLVNELKASILYAEGSNDEAKTHADLAIQNGSQNVATYLISGVVAFQQGKFEQANEHFKKIDPLVPANHFVKRLYTITQFKLGNIDDAMNTLNNFNGQTEQDSTFLSSMSVELARLGREDEALTLAQKASANGSGNSQVKLGLIQLANNDTSGLDTLQQALNVNPDLKEAKLGLTYFYLKMGKIDDAEKTIDEWLTESSANAQAMLLKGLVYQIKQQPDQAKNWYQKVLATDSENIQARLAVAQLADKEEGPDAAYSEAMKAYQLEPTNPMVFRHVVRFAYQSDQMADLNKVIGKQLSESPNSDALKVQKATTLAVNTEYQPAIELLETISPHNQSSSSLRLLADLYNQQQDYDNALTYYSQWLAKEPLNPNAYIKNIQLNELVGRVDNSLKLTTKARNLFINDTRFTLMQAGLLLKEGKSAQSQALLNQQPDEVKQTAYYLRLQSMIHLQNKAYPEAINALEQRYDTLPNQDSAASLAMAYEMAGKTDQAITFLKSVIKEYGNKADALQIRLADLQVKYRPDEAIEQYETILVREPNNIIALNNIAWLYLEKGDTDKACRSANKAHELASKRGNIPEILDTYGYCLLKSGQIAPSLQLLKEAYAKKHDDAEIALHYAESLLENKQDDNAKEVLEKISTTDPRLIAIKGQLQNKLSAVN